MGGDLGFSTKTGAFNKESRTHMTLISCIQLGCYPKYLEVGMIPVNVAAEIVLAQCLDLASSTDIPVILAGNRVEVSSIFPSLRAVSSLEFRQRCIREPAIALAPFVGSWMIHALALPPIRDNPVYYSNNDFSLMLDFAYEKGFLARSSRAPNNSRDQIDIVTDEILSEFSGLLSRNMKEPGGPILFFVEGEKSNVLGLCLQRYLQSSRVHVWTKGDPENHDFSFFECGKMVLIPEREGRFSDFGDLMNNKMAFFRDAFKIASMSASSLIYLSSPDAVVPAPNFPLGMWEKVVEVLFENLHEQSFQVSCLRIGAVCDAAARCISEPLIKVVCSLGYIPNHYTVPIASLEEIARKLFMLSFERPIWYYYGDPKYMRDVALDLGFHLKAKDEVEFMELLPEDMKGKYHYMTMFLDPPVLESDRI